MGTYGVGAPPVLVVMARDRISVYAQNVPQFIGD